MSVNEKMTSIADGLRTLSSTSELMGLDAMSGHISQANDTVDTQSALITQIKRALRGKGTAADGTVEPAKEEQEVTFPTITENGNYEILPDDGKVMSKAIVNVDVPTGDGSNEPALVESGTCGESATWEFYSDGKFVVSGTGDTSDYSSTTQPWSNIKTDVTEVIINEGITSIGQYFCYKFSNMTSVTIPNTIETIGSWSFAHTGVINVDIPYGVITIGEGAFYYCKSLKNINIPNSVTTINEGVFQDCTNLISINIPDSVTVLGNHSLRNTDSLTGIAIGNGISTIGIYTFYSCNNLTNITIPNSVTTIENRAFGACPNLTSVFYEGTKAQWDLINIDATNNDALLTATLHCEYEEATEGGSGDDGTSKEFIKAMFNGTLTELKAEDFDGVSIIKPYAFYQQTSLETVDIPDSVTEISKSAFAGCAAIKTLKMPYAASVSSDTFSNCSNIENLTLTPGTGTITEYNYTTVQRMPWWISRSKIQNVTLCDGITRVGNHLFRQLSALTSIVIPKGVTELGSYAFYESGLKSITIPKSVIKIGERCFYYCNDLVDFYYEGSEEEWAAIEVGSLSMYDRGTVHYNTPM